MNGTLVTDFGAGSTASAPVLVPDELVSPHPARDIQSLLRILHRDWMAKQVFYGHRQAFSYADTIPFTLQLYPILT